jgi:PPM family protein phosphatase
MVVTMRACSSCSTPAGDDDRYCEHCGAVLADAPPSSQSGGPARAGGSLADGVPVEIALSSALAAATNRGMRRRANEDAIAVGVGLIGDEPIQVMVVCDGVSTTPAAAKASERAVHAMRGATLEAVAQGRSPLEAMRLGMEAAQAAVCALPAPSGKEPPATTLVAALVGGGEIVLAWMGDSRAYFLDGAGGRLLTRDDSWLNEVVESGKYTVEEAKRRPHAHAITKCLGRLEDGEDFAPNITAVATPSEGFLLLCSDGLWNYVDQPEELAGLISGADSALTACRRLIAKANASGGRDNISVALLALRQRNSSTC